MVRETTIQQLKAQLLRDVASLCRRSDRVWSQPIVQTLRDFRKAKLQAVFFGGTLRSLLLSRLRHQRPGRPRDVDIVVAGMSASDLREKFHPIIVRQTRFGGFQLERMNWQFDVWPLQCTWAFVQDGTQSPRFAALPSTTFFNLEAIAVDVWAPPGRSRTIYSGDDQFFQGIISQTLEINREENPFPALCVVRSIVMAYSTGFAIGPRLARYLTRTNASISDSELMDAQRNHYGRIRCDVPTMRRWLEHIEESHSRDSRSTIALPQPRQLMLWPEEGKWPKVNCYILSYARRKEPTLSSRGKDDE